MKAELLYVTDAYCIWCHGFGKTINQLAHEFASTINVRVVNGGMIPSNLPLADMFSRFPDPMALHRQVTETSGQEFGKRYLSEIKRYKASRWILNSSTPARALAAFKLLGVKGDLSLTSAIQRRYYIDGCDLQDVATYQSIAADFGIDFATFKKQFAGREAAQAVKQDRQLVEQLGIQGFPALLLRVDDNSFTPIARGFMPFTGVKANLETALARHFPAATADIDGQMCGLDGEGC
ncbi:MAG: DsbA family protein [Proteobacteria bacterium]|jgi:putative protein-disulfide isomerase|nr:DsbA family protein [Pseudomonadota bacterium]